MLQEVVKRDGRKEPLDKSKVEEVIKWACEGLGNVSVPNVLMQANLHFYDGITTVEIHDALINAAKDLINEYDPEYQYVAGRLLMTKLRKEAYGQHEPPKFKTHLSEMVMLGLYDKELTNKYSEEDMDELESHLDHEKDMQYSYAGMVQFQKKYLIQNRVTGVVYESPQYAYMCIAMCLHEDEKVDRLSKVKAYYDAVSDMKISLPTPILGGVRSPTKQFSSCCLIETADNLDSINAVGNAIVNYSAARAGIGINAGRIRSEKAPIRGGEAWHTGSIGFYKKFQADMGSCSQG